jgi:PAS domain S-box-containing protein
VNGINEQLNGTDGPALSTDALKTAASPWRSMFEESSLGIARTDLKGRFLDTNRAYGKLAGYSNAELQALTLLDLVAEDDRAANVELMEQLRHGDNRIFRSRRVIGAKTVRPSGFTLRVPTFVASTNRRVSSC